MCVKAHNLRHTTNGFKTFFKPPPSSALSTFALPNLRRFFLLLPACHPWARTERASVKNWCNQKWQLKCIQWAIAPFDRLNCISSLFSDFLSCTLLMFFARKLQKKLLSSQSQANFHIKRAHFSRDFLALIERSTFNFLLRNFFCCCTLLTSHSIVSEKESIGWGESLYRSMIRANTSIEMACLLKLSQQ